MKFYGMRILAALFAAGAVWRAFVALHHYRSSLAAKDDPSTREFELVSSLFEGGVSMVLLVHGVALFALARRRLQIRWPYALGVALACASIMIGSWLHVPVLAWPGAYAVAIVVSVAILSHFLAFGWVSLYLGALAGSLLACQVMAPASDVFLSLIVVAPCVGLAFLGAGLRLLVVRIAAARAPD